ncbi:hypothetical protein KQ939_13770 [Planococcus sp. CP5-4]|uniref:hypothetical protein n=1 Tax=Planococcus TaxID=1372 RepID=UPI001B8D4014|nr:MULTISPECIES: hypothetical protein [unclassified Planococcus (in: firmicutes)]MBU9674002.1 hypothetical protein [Planococcus sp. CP5-4_YE]MBV0909873.1 hypothetical protein [Planococcus sp. CP5-4_UN]MBW6064753.1 hypothetical protein [Planococcus sp. CP5-4]
MATDTPKKPQFNVDQITSASKAAKQLAHIRAAAKKEPQFISANNTIDSVILDYAQYEKMYQELETYRELNWYEEIARRAAEAEAHPEQTIPLREAVGEESYARIMAIDPDDISDDELFE